MQVTRGHIGTEADEPRSASGTSQEPCRACERTHGTVEDLLSLIPAPIPAKAKGDPFVTMSGRAAKAWLALFAHARMHGTWQPRHVDPFRPELTEDRQHTLTVHWTVNALGFVMGVNRDTAGKALKELAQGGWIKRESPRNKGQFGGIDYSLAVPTTVTQADKSRVADGLRERGVEYRSYEYRTAARVLEDHEIERVQADVELKIQEERADLAGDEAKAIASASAQILRQRMGETKQETSPSPDIIPFGDLAVEHTASAERSGRC